LNREIGDIHFFRDGDSGALSWLGHFSLRGEEAEPTDFLDVRKRRVLERPIVDVGVLGDSHSVSGERCCSMNPSWLATNSFSSPLYSSTDRASLTAGPE
jgi:hypothetical protein